MPKRKTLEINKLPYQYKNTVLRITKSYTKPNFNSHTILTNDPFAYVKFYFNTKLKTVKYRDKVENKKKYGAKKRYDYSFIGNRQNTSMK